jgi:hypothetical protein
MVVVPLEKYSFSCVKSEKERKKSLRSHLLEERGPFGKVPKKGIFFSVPGRVIQQKTEFKVHLKI